MAGEGQILSVTALTRAIKARLEGAFPFVWVRGQVTNVSRPASGHLYFSLRDAENTLAAVWFKQQQTRAQQFDPLTGEVFEEGTRPNLAQTLANGQEIICAGRLTVYGPRGSYQMVVELAEEAGIGSLQAEFDRLRAKLYELGYFNLERKRPLPSHPKNIALITSPHGAAVYDFLRIAETRGHGSTVRLYPVQVQGAEAPEAILRAITRIRQQGQADVIVLVRGGGSLEDLWAFNDERVAKAVFEAPVPVLAGIGHEVDFTLADLTADVRAATPTHAAQLLWPERTALYERLHTLHTKLHAAGTRQLTQRAGVLIHYTQALHWQSPQRKLALWGQRLQNLTEALRRSPPQNIATQAAQLARLHVGLGRAAQRLPREQARLASLTQRLAHSGDMRVMEALHRVERLSLRLEAVNPHAPLARGYALVQNSQGQFIRSANAVTPGQHLHVTLHQGAIDVTVDGEERDKNVGEGTPRA
ncbi:exodeoxyribonuclease VII large subunit [Desulfovibrio cuneatus]|uniref:exodeoxyribonuclease VII large subunit n=1 Tax=Desulfovibrio cuneatus TaxID=159728 RepID=UPI0003FEC3D1|nr:exodeoxyribonuclease VII large subunit [Desulfovibrio cuneatus]